MKYFRQRWYLLGIWLAFFGIAALVFWHQYLSPLRVLLSISFISLLLHQFEEYQFPGFFPRMVNSVMFKKTQPDRFPLNANTACLINVGLGWSLYVSTIVLAQHAIWFATATITISIGNILAHTIFLNIKGKTSYNPGMATALVLFLPISIYYFEFLSKHGLISSTTLVIGLILGVIINYFGILIPIVLLGDKNSPYPFKPFH